MNVAFYNPSDASGEQAGNSGQSKGALGDSKDRTTGRTGLLD